MCKCIGIIITIYLSAVDCEWNEFGEWTSCSKSCGGGEKTRIRTIKTTEQHGGSSCLGELTETQLCNVDSCPGMHNTY